jgi:hypothetical protein
MQNSTSVQLQTDGRYLPLIQQKPCAGNSCNTQQRMYNRKAALGWHADCSAIVARLETTACATELHVVADLCTPLEVFPLLQAQLALQGGGELMQQ